MVCSCSVLTAQVWKAPAAGQLEESQRYPLSSPASTTGATSITQSRGKRGKMAAGCSCRHLHQHQTSHCSPGSAVVQVSSFGSWNCVGFLSMAAAIRSSKGRFSWGCPQSISAMAESSSTSIMSSSTSFCSELGVSVLALDVGVPGRLALLSKILACALALMLLLDLSNRSASLVGEVVLFPDLSTNPFTCPSSFFCSRFCTTWIGRLIMEATNKAHQPWQICDWRQTASENAPATHYNFPLEVIRASIKNSLMAAKVQETEQLKRTKGGEEHYHVSLLSGQLYLSPGQDNILQHLVLNAWQSRQLFTLLPTLRKSTADCSLLMHSTNPGTAYKPMMGWCQLEKTSTTQKQHTAISWWQESWTRCNRGKLYIAITTRSTVQQEEVLHGLGWATVHCSSAWQHHLYGGTNLLHH